MSRVMDALVKWNKVGPAALLWTNMVIAVMVLVAHGGFLLLVRAGKVPVAQADVGITYVTIPLALALVASAAVALLRPSLRWPVLKGQSLVLALGALFSIYAGMEVAMFGIPPGVNVAWNPVMFAFVAAYPVYLLQRAFALAETPASTVALQAPLWAIGISILISAIVMWRIWNVAS